MHRSLRVPLGYLQVIENCGRVSALPEPPIMPQHENVNFPSLFHSILTVLGSVCVAYSILYDNNGSVFPKSRNACRTATNAGVERRPILK